MNVQEFIDKIVEEFPDLKKDKITPEMNFRDHVEWDSINALVLIAMVNVEYDVIITAEELINAETVNDVYLVVEKKVKEKEQEKAD